MTDPIDYQSRLKQAFLAMKKMRARLEAIEQERAEPLAIIGAGCRFPGGVDSPEAYWRLLRDGVDAITEIPPDRWDVDAYYDPDPDAPGKMYAPYGGFLENIDQFDPQFFGIAPREVNNMDPQQRLFLEVAWEALENAGLAPDRLKGSQTGVFVGITASDYMQLHAKYLDPTQINAYLASGNVPNVTPGRLSYLLGLHGPSVAMDTACSSSLIAIHMACQSLRLGESKMVIAGGVNMMLVPEITVCFSKWGMLSPNGRCKTFDAGADGFVRGEGCGVVIIKRLADALAGGDNILALIRGSAANQDGPSSGLSVPNGLAQAEVIRQALANAGVEPNAVRYVETHGTGTTLGDPIEVEAMGAALCPNRPAGQPLAIGSVKTNIGHLEAASGVAGLLKAVLALQHEEIPPHLHLRERSPYIKWENLPIEIPTKRTPWPRGQKPRIAGVSSFGFSGTNAHVVLEEAPLPQAAEQENGEIAPRPLHLLNLSAKNDQALQELAGRFARHFEERPATSLPDVCFTANTGRAHFQHRLSVLADSVDQARQKLAAFNAGQTTAGVQRGQASKKNRPKIAFLFTGQGSQYVGMGRQLYETQPTFRAALDRCDELLRPYLEHPLLSVIFAEEQGSRGAGEQRRTVTPAPPHPRTPSPPHPLTPSLLDETAYTQPALFAIEYALAQLWQSWGIKPSVVMGHSVGEYVAACVAGVFSLEDGLKLIVERGRLMGALPGNGAMAAVFAGEAHVQAAIAPYADQVSIAAVNGPDNIVISGLATAVQTILDQLQREGTKARRLAVSHAFHSLQMEPVLDAFEKAAAAITYSTPQIGLISNVTGKLAAGQTVTNAAYWRQHIRQAVRFADAMATLREQGYTIFLEIGPNPILSGMGQRILESEGAEERGVKSEERGAKSEERRAKSEERRAKSEEREVKLADSPTRQLANSPTLWLPSLRKGRDDWQQMLQSLSTLYVRGANVEWATFDRDYTRRRISLPTYPFQRERYWIEGMERALTPSPRSAELTSKPHPLTLSPLHPLLGRRLRSPLLKEAVFESQISTGAIPFLADHQVQGVIVLPATAYVETVLAAANEVFGAGAHILADITIHEALTLAADEVRTIQLIVTAGQTEEATFQLFSLERGQNQEEVWQLHAAGKVRRSPEATAVVSESDSLTAVQARCQEEVPVAAYYQQFRQRDIQFGPAFRGVTQLWRRDGEAVGQIETPPTLARETEVYQLHPAILDACWQVFPAAWSAAAGLGQNGRNSPAELDTYMPLSLDSIQLYRRPGRRLWSHAVLRSGDGRNQETRTGDIRLFDENGRIVAEINGLLVKRARRGALQRAGRAVWRHWLYEVAWPPQIRPGHESSPLSAAQIAAEMQPQVAQLQAQHGLTVAEQLLPQVDALSTAYVTQALRQLGWTFTPEQSVSAPALADELGIVQQHHRLLGRLLEMLAEDGVLRPNESGWQVVRAPDPIDPQERATTLQDQYPTYEGELSLLARCGAQLAEVLRGTADPLQLLFPAGSLDTLEKLYQDAPSAQMYNKLVAETVATAVSSLPEEQTVRILEIGAGTGGTTSHILPQLPAGRAEYVFTDISNLFLAQAQEKYGDYPFVRTQFLDIEQDPETQGFSAHQFDLVVAANVVHATRDLRQSLGHIRQLLAPEGMLVLLEGVIPRRWIDLTFGLTGGWWRFTDTDLRPAHPLLAQGQWRHLLEKMGFRQATAVSGTETSSLFPQAVILGRRPQAQDAEQETGTWLIFADEGGVGRGLAQLLEARGEGSILVSPGADYEMAAANHWQLDPTRPQQFQQLLTDAPGDGRPPCRGVIHLWSLDATLAEDASVADLAATQARSSGSVLHLAQALAGARLPATPRLWLVTRGAQPAGALRQETAIAQAPVWGLGKVIALEHPELRCTRVDLEPAATAAPSELEALFAEIWSPDAEDQVAIRNNTRHVARLVRSRTRHDAVAASQPRRDALPTAPQPESQPVRLEIGTPGLLDSLELRPMSRQQPAAGEVEIQVRATGLNFRDVLNAMGMYPGDAGALGGECTGVIAALGPGVAGFAVGDEVIAIAPGSFSSFVTTRAEFVVHKPPHLSFPEAATILVTYMTAYYALHHLAKMSAGDRVLIHAAAGGVGMAAVQLAQQAGAEIFATAGSPRKRAFLQSLGVHHVMDSRSLDFADEIMALTGGRGVDVVLNSLADEFIPASISVLAENGRFLEIGKRGVWDADQVAQAKPQAAYFVIDLVAKANENPALIQKVLHELIALFNEGEIKPLPHRIFPIQDAVNAFRYMAQAKHIGKIVVTQQEQRNRGAEEQRSLTPAPPHPVRLSSRRSLTPSPPHPDATYLITGGLAGLGLLVAEWLVEQGARYLVLMGRSGASAAARERIARMEQAGVQVTVAQADVSQAEQVANVLAGIDPMMPPLRGVIHSAGVLDDGALLQQEWSRFTKVFAPKVDGGWLLHTLTRHLPLDFFVLFSSGSAVLGSPGQGNHAAANAFLDALAHYRQAQGLPALSINWGVWSQIGAAARRNVSQRISERGIGTISPEQGIQVLAHLMGHAFSDSAVAPTQVGVFPVEWTKFTQQYPTGSPPPFFAAMASEERPRPAQSEAVVAPPTEQKAALWQQLEAAPLSKRLPLLRDHVRAQSLKVLGLGPSHPIDFQQPLSELGLDSLMAVELRNLLGSDLQLQRPLPATLVFDYPTVAALADYLAEELFSWETETPPEDDGRETALAELEQLSEDEAEALLLAELAAMKKGN